MSKGIQKRIQPDLVAEIEEYQGGSFSEKLLKWKNDVDTLSHSDVKDAVEESLPAGVFR
jgi:hypothetical protein